METLRTFVIFNQLEMCIIAYRFVIYMNKTKFARLVYNLILLNVLVLSGPPLNCYVGTKNMDMTHEQGHVLKTDIELVDCTEGTRDIKVVFDTAKALNVLPHIVSKYIKEIEHCIQEFHSCMTI